VSRLLRSEEQESFGLEPGYITLLEFLEGVGEEYFQGSRWIDNGTTFSIGTTFEAENDDPETYLRVNFSPDGEPTKRFSIQTTYGDRDDILQEFTDNIIDYMENCNYGHWNL